MGEDKKWQSYTEKEEAIRKYQAKKAQISLTVEPEQKERWQAAARARNMSLTKFIVKTVDEKVKEKEKEKET